MKTYYCNGYLFYYDFYLRLWTIYKASPNGDQLQDEADHYSNKQQLLSAYPDLKFTLYNKE